VRERAVWSGPSCHQTAPGRATSVLPADTEFIKPGHRSTEPRLGTIITKISPPAIAGKSVASSIAARSQRELVVTRLPVLVHVPHAELHLIKSACDRRVLGLWCLLYRIRARSWTAHSAPNSTYPRQLLAGNSQPCTRDPRTKPRSKAHL
jgi:hypothetical protein